MVKINKLKINKFKKKKTYLCRNSRVEASAEG